MQTIGYTINLDNCGDNWIEQLYHAMNANNALRVDSTQSNREEAQRLIPDILGYLQGVGTATMADIYHDLDCGDIPMYLAMRALVLWGAVYGPDPYDPERAAGNHTTMVYHYPAVRPTFGL